MNIQIHKNSSQLFESLFEKLNHFLEEQNLKKTPERFAILKTIINYNDNFEINDLFKEFENKKYLISKSTFYNTIKLFEKCGIVEKIFLNNKIKYHLPNLGNSYVINNQKENFSITIDKEIEKLLIDYVEENYKINVKYLNTIFYV